MKITSAEFIISAVDSDNYPKDDLPQIVFSGRSNVGKSSFINSLLNQKKIAKVSQTPGKTRLINFFLINKKFYFVDIPGYGYAKVNQAEMVKFATMIDEYLQSGLPSLAILLLDIRRTPNEDDLLMYDYFKSCGFKILIALTKADKLSKNKIIKQKQIIEKNIKPRVQDTMIEYSIETKINHELIWNIILNQINEG
ncbi:MAG: ribosome biogenesis GTP-binding protein YihA/YsxC [Candidatus Izimaplasma sp.]|nr:ribosome biogenesis GTP-binding protein YihA/YsxC [Candidatus Izimaplasma bacterium]